VEEEHDIETIRNVYLKGNNTKEDHRKKEIPWPGSIKRKEGSTFQIRRKTRVSSLENSTKGT